MEPSRTTRNLFSKNRTDWSIPTSAVLRYFTLRNYLYALQKPITSDSKYSDNIHAVYYCRAPS